MNLYKILFLWICGMFIWLLGNSYWENTGSKWANSPIFLLDQFWHDVNSWDRIQDTALNDFNPNQWQYASEYRIANTFDALRIQIAPYIQWVMYIWLSLAIIGIVYNGFLMVVKPAWVTSWESSKVKSRLLNIVNWVFLLTGFYVIIQAILAIISYVLK